MARPIPCPSFFNPLFVPASFSIALPPIDSKI
jgi:hypothetical protein